MQDTWSSCWYEKMRKNLLWYMENNDRDHRWPPPTVLQRTYIFVWEITWWRKGFRNEILNGIRHNASKMHINGRLKYPISSTFFCQTESTSWYITVDAWSMWHGRFRMNKTNYHLWIGHDICNHSEMYTKGTL